ncbi:MAG: M14 family zinc carboxypeptidase [Candidatus Thermoplasmatota archaeon]|nr:M14 family zinc carboxypeptidase [Candidatus Thermoplasmatota archaeon]
MTSRRALVVFLAVILIGIPLLSLQEGGAHGSWYAKPDSYAQLVEWYRSLEERYPQVLEVFKANELYHTGQVAGGYDLWYVRITNESTGLHKPEVLFLGSPHGDETVGTVGMYWFTDWLLRQACDSGDRHLQWLLDHREVYFAVSQNPYGFDRVQRGDSHGWDLNREADYDGPARSGPPEVWGSVPGQTLREFVNHHQVRVGADFHGGARMLLYPWSSTHRDVEGVSPQTGAAYSYAPPDFYFYDAASLRLGAYMGRYGGPLNQGNIGPIPVTVGYEAPGSIAPWAYGANVARCPAEAPFVKNELFGPYPGAGIMWLSPEMSTVKNPPEWRFGSDVVPGYGMEVRRFLLHQIDLAQPYLRWVGQPEWSADGLTVSWQVNGSLVVDGTVLQWSTRPDVVDNPMSVGILHDEYAGQYLGGTGWDSAWNGRTRGVIWSDTLAIPPNITDLYLVARARVDQVYAQVLAPHEYGSRSYLRLVEERTNASFYEEIEGTDGPEVIGGQTWWYSPVMHVVLGGLTRPRMGMLYVNDREVLPLPGEKTVIVGPITLEAHAPDGQTVSFYVDGEIMGTDSSPPYAWTWNQPAVGRHTVTVSTKTLEDSRQVWIFNPGL